ncbi:Ergosterol biosynthetic protein 28 [Dichanthelium oligosanthes]|uniref:Ergosterol biosynthetic protein 28 n=1 Tax=Dichanthelium oligosanthes TaxID=888268 RepID=A0A1E5WFU6_9POAL|nr:Ergosterol biosynthetic protein 28 [Dichanthelium oligosanthes]
MAAAGKQQKNGGVPALGWWLMAVGTRRLGLTWSGFFGAATYAEAEMTGVHGRTFGVWTLLSCTLCFLCAFNLGNRPLYVATFMFFVYAYAHFILEYLVYHTFTAANLGTLGFFAVTSIVWMLLQWNSHGHRPRIAAKQP